MSKSRWYVPPPQTVPRKHERVYSLQKKQWERQLKGHLAPKPIRKQQEEKNADSEAN